MGWTPATGEQPPTGRSGRHEVVLGTATAAAALAYHPAAPAAATKSVALLVVGLAALGLTLPRLLGRAGRQRWRLPAALAAWLGLCGWYALSRAWSDAADLGPLPSWLGAGALGLAASSLEPRAVRRGARIAAWLTGTGASVAVLLEALTGARGLALHGLQGNPNWLGLVVAAALPLEFEAVQRLRELPGRRWLLAGALAVLSVPALVLSASRVAGVALVVTALWFARSQRQRLALVAAAAVALLALDITHAGSSLAGRLWLARVSARAALNALPLGTGLGGFAAAFLDAQGTLLAPLTPAQAAARFANATTAHDDWLEVATVGGPVALALLATVVGLAVLPLRRRWPAGAATTLVVAIAALGDCPLHLPAVVALLAWVWAATARIPLGRPFMIVHATVLAGVVLLLPPGLGHWLAQRAMVQARAAGPARRVALLEHARHLDPGSGEAWLLLGLTHLELGQPAEALASLERSRRLLANLGTDVALGNAYLELGQARRAATCYQRALARHPGYFRARANLVEALRQLGQLDEAAEQLRIARQLQPGHPKLGRIAERLRQARIEAETR